jgi:hypothetical protein
MIILALEHSPQFISRVENANRESGHTGRACIWIPGPVLRTVPE